MTTTKAATKRAERERRRAAGYKRVDVWISRETQEGIADIIECASQPFSLEDAVAHAVFYGRKYAD